MPPTDSRPGPGPTSGLRVGFVPGVTLTKWRTLWAERFPGHRLDVVEVTEADQRRVLIAGEVDMCFVRLPVDTDGLHLIRRYDEVPVVVMPTDHPLAEFAEVEVADLASETLLADAAAPDAMDRVAWGQGLLRVPLSVARTHHRRDLTHRPITDAEPTTVGLAWLVDNEHELIEEFIGIVRGRTVNSARTAQARAAKPQPAAEKKPRRTPPRPPRPQRSAPPRRRGR